MNAKVLQLVLMGLLITILLGGNASGSFLPFPASQNSANVAFASPGEAEGQENGPEIDAAEVVQLFWHEAIGRPAFLGTDRSRAAAMGLSPEQARDPKAVALAFTSTQRSALRLPESDEIQWRAKRTEIDERAISHVFLQQVYNGLPVFASEVAVHVKDGGVIAANGEYPAAIGVSAKPTLSVEAAYKAAFNKLDLAYPLLISSELVIYNPALLDDVPSANHLAYYLVVGQEELPDLEVVFIDAHTGKVLFNYNNLHEEKNRDIRDLNGSTRLPGSPCYTESGPVSGGSPSTDCTNAYNFTGDTYDYFFNTYGRDSFNGSGATMRASVRYGTQGNAFWNGSQTTFGPGFTTKDVVAHEWGHAVTQYTAGLVYANQSGALNESMSDVFGAMVDRDDWLMGEDTPIGALRSLADPTRFGDPGKVSDNQYYCGSQDNGGVHINSGVPNHTAYLMAEGGSYNGQTITAIGRDRTEQIFYKALTTYLTSGSNFNDAYNGLISACGDLYGSGSATCTSVTNTAQATEMNQSACGSGGSGTPDSYEDDDTSSQANTITVNDSAQSHNFHDAGDNDWVLFTATAGTSYVIETSNLASSSDTYMYLYDSSRTLISDDDDSGTGRASRIAWSPSSNGTYYVRIRHYSSSAYGANTDYDLSISGTGGSTGADSYENDDTLNNANAITVNGPAQSHNFHDAGDNDWVSFSATNGSQYIIETSNLGGDSDTYMYLYNSSGTLLASDDDSGTGRASRIEWSASSSGIVYLRVTHYSSSAYGVNTNYDLRVRTGGVSGDSYEDDDTASNANLIATTGATQSHNFHDAGDNDWVTFSATAGSSYVIETLNLGSQNDTYMYLYDTDGTTEISRNDDGGTERASRIAWSAPSSGTYYVRIRHYSSSAYGTATEYDLSVTGDSSGSGDSYEPDDNASQASPITANDSGQSHNFHDAGDRDWLSFSATAGMDYIIETSNLGSNSDTFMELYESDGSTVITSDDDGGTGLASRISWTASANGTYYVQVRHYSSSRYGQNTEYDLRITSSGSPSTADSYEEDDSASQASTITSTQTDHNFHDADDNDWAKFLATAGTSYVIETLNLDSRSDTYLELYDTNGTTRLDSDDDSGSGVASRIGWNAPANGTYYIRVRHYNSMTYGANTNYDLRVTSGSSATGDSYEEDDNFANASTITVNSEVQTHDFHDAGDHDWVKFETSDALVPITMQTSNLGANSDTYLQLYDTDGRTLLESNDDGGGGLASRIQWTPEAAGTYYVKVRHYNPSVHGSGTNYDLEVISSGSSDGDSYEPDNTASQASTMVTDGTTQSHDFHIVGDNDWVQFSAEIGTSYVMETLNLGNNSDTFMNLYQSDGSTIITSDDDGGTGRASRIEWTAPANGTYYVMVRHYNSSAYGANTNYDLSVTASSSSSGGDSYEPDNAYSQANSITTDGTTQTHDFHVAGDNDWVSFSATNGATYVMETLNLDSNSDTYLEFYDTNGTTLLGFDDDGGTGRASRIEWTAPANATYYVMVRHYNNSAKGADTNYDLRVTSSGSADADSYENDDTSTQANTILSDSIAQSHNFHDEADNDWVKFATDSGKTCIIETSNLGSRNDTYMQLYDTDGTTLITSDDDSGLGRASRIVYSISSSDTYYVKVRHYDSTIYGANTNYDLAVDCSGSSSDSYEPDDTFGQATPITVNGSPQTHTFHVAGDNDWLHFSATSGTSYVIETFNLGDNSDTVIFLYDTDGTTLIDSNDDDGETSYASRLAWTAPASGTYYVKVRHYSNSAFGPDTNYDLRVTTSSTLLAPAASVEFASGLASVGDEVEATIYIHKAISAIKVEALAKPAHLNLIEAMPLSQEGKALARQVTADASRWQMTSTTNGLTSVWYSGKVEWDGSNIYPVLRLRWQLIAPLPTEKFSIPFKLTTIDQNGQATTEVLKLNLVTPESEPKIDSVEPTSFSNASDTILSLRGSNFLDTPKVYLLSSSENIPLAEATLIIEGEVQIVRGVVPAGTKADRYKMQLVNPDDGSTQYDGEIEILEIESNRKIYLPILLKN